MSPGETDVRILPILKRAIVLGCRENPENIRITEGLERYRDCLLGPSDRIIGVVRFQNTMSARTGGVVT